LRFAFLPICEGDCCEARYLQLEGALEEIANNRIVENLAQKISKDAVHFVVKQHQEADCKNCQNCEKHAAANQKHHAHVLNDVLFVSLLDAEPV